jgi:hypothetical protein
MGQIIINRDGTHGEPEHIMLDLETYSTHSDAKIIQLAAVKFNLNPLCDEDDLEIIDELLVNVETDIGHVEKRTVRFWEDLMENDEELAESMLTPDPVSLQSALCMYQDFANGAKNVWSHGATFDPVIIDNAFKATGMARNNPFKYHQPRCCRTMQDFLDTEERHEYHHTRFEGIPVLKHNALYDCYMQTYQLQRTFALLKDHGVKYQP